MSNIKTDCIVALTAFISIITTLAYITVGTIPESTGVVEFSLVWTILGVVLCPTILGIVLGIEIVERYQNKK